MPEQDADIFEVLISQMRECRNINPVLGKPLSVLGHAECFEPVSNLLHRGPHPGFNVARPSFWTGAMESLPDKFPA